MTAAADIYEPAEDTYLLADVLAKQGLSGKRVLEIGCGSGFLATLAAEKGADITAVDIADDAVEATRRLLEERSLKADVFSSDLFGRVEGKFDLILFNPPYLPDSQPESRFASPQWSGGKDGRITIERFVKDVGGFLRPGGKVLLLVSSLTGETAVLSLFHGKGLSTRIVARKKIDWEELLVIEASI